MRLTRLPSRIAQRAASKVRLQPDAMVGGTLNVEFLRLLGPLHDEAEPCGGILPHQLVDHAIGDDLTRQSQLSTAAASSG